jgi:predicted RNA-binding protein with PIN domain
MTPVRISGNTPGVHRPVVILVDARNVLRSRWPNIPERRLVELCRAWAAANGRLAIVVFDGRAPDGLVGEAEIDEHCRLVGTGAETADEWLARTASELHAEGRSFVLVTSDRALRAVAGRHAERTIGGGSFARELEG